MYFDLGCHERGWVIRWGGTPRCSGNILQPGIEMPFLYIYFSEPGRNSLALSGVRMELLLGPHKFSYISKWTWLASGTFFIVILLIECFLESLLIGLILCFIPFFVIVCAFICYFMCWWVCVRHEFYVYHVCGGQEEFGSPCNCSHRPREPVYGCWELDLESCKGSKLSEPRAISLALIMGFTVERALF